MKPVKLSRRRVIVLAILLVAACWFLVYILSGVADAINMDGFVLRGLQKEWVFDGSPQPPPLKKYVEHASDPERFLVCTNDYIINGQTYTSIFGMTDRRFEGKGVLVVSRTGELIWVGTGKSPKLVRLRQ